MREFTIEKNDANQRADKFLFKVLDMPTSLLYKSIRSKKIKLNGKRLEINYKLQLGDKISCYVNDEFFKLQQDNLAFTKIAPKIDIIYEDENIILVDKKPGMIAHEDINENLNTLINHIKAYLYKKGEYNPSVENSFAPALANRIDRNTGGIVIAAKNAQALRVLNEKIKTKEIRKFYLCLVFGTLNKKSATLTAFHEKNTDQNRVYISDKKADNLKEIITKYKVLKEKNNISLVEVELITGRTHQIRAHFAHIGHPLVGDGKYGKNTDNKKANRFIQALYSYKIIFDFKSPADCLEYLRGKEISIRNIDFVNDFENC